MTDALDRPSLIQAAETSRPRLILIDGYSLLFRAYLTPGPYFSTADGRPTGAVRGFTNMLLSLLGQEKPDSIYVAWDAPGKTFRDDKFDQYKAHRPDVGEDLRTQFPVARQIVEAFGIASMETPGFEADDLIGTLSRIGVKEGYDVVIVTGDSDQLQLIREGVKVRMTRTGVTDTELFDADRVREKYGVGPEQIADYKALVGDTSDNIPGVPGIGKITAAKLLQQWGSMETLLSHVDDLPPSKIRENLANNIDIARLSLELATIHCEVPFQGEIQPYRPTTEDWSRVRDIFADLEFKTLAARLPALPSEGLEATTQASGLAGTYSFACTVVQSVEQFEQALAAIRAAGTAAIQIDAGGGPATQAGLRGIAFAPDAGQAFYVRISDSDNGSFARGNSSGGLFADDSDAPFSVSLSALAPILDGEEISRASYNAKPMLIVAERHGASVGPIAFDAMIAAYLLNTGRSSYPLEDLAEEHLNQTAGFAEAESKEAQNCREAALAAALRDPMERRIEEMGLADIFRRIELPLIPILADMERVGVPVDRNWLGRLSHEMGLKAATLQRRIFELAGEEFTIGSTQQLQRILFEKLQLPTGKKIKTGFSTRADLLESLAAEHEIARRILEWREVTKLKSTYADALPKLINPETGRIHTSLNQTVAATGRLSSSDPNLQNIPIRSEIGREIRKAFVAPPGQVLLSCDYSQIELRVFAHVTKDPEMMRAFTANEDIHAATASRIFGVPIDQVNPDMRRKAKTVNFAVIYGQSDFGLASTLGIPAAEAKEFIDSYFAQFPGVREYTERTLESARELGYVKTFLGRRRYVPDIRSGNFNIRQAAERAAVNMPIQGAAADIMKLAMIDVYLRLRKMCYNCTLLLQVHDELVFGVDAGVLPTVAPDVVRHMEGAFSLDVPLRVDAKQGPNWAEMVPVQSGT